VDGALPLLLRISAMLFSLFPRRARVALGLAATLPAAMAETLPRSDAENVRALRSLSPEAAARGVPFVIGGAATYWTLNSLNTMQVDGEALWLENVPPLPGLTLGTRVRVSGVSTPGGFSPNLRCEKIELLPAVPPTPPVPMVVSAAQLLGGHLDCQWVEVRGILRALEPSPHHSSGRTHLTLSVDGHRITGRIEQPWSAAMSARMGSEVVLTAVLAHYFTQTGQMTGPNLLLLGTDQIRELRPPLPAREAPLVRISGLRRPLNGISWQDRVRVSGKVIWQKGRSLQIEDGDRGLHVTCLLPAPVLTEGDIVELCGYVADGLSQPVLEDTVMCGQQSGTGTPEATPLGQLLPENLDQRLISTQGRVLTLSREAERGTLLIETGRGPLTALLEEPPPPAWASLQPGDTVETTGLWLASTVELKEAGVLTVPKSFQLKLRRPGDLRLVSRAPWWTAGRLAAGCITLALLVAGMSAAVIRVRRRNQHLQAEISRRHLAEAALQQARIAEQASYAALTDDRTRMARELHDSLAQTLAAAAFRFDALAITIADRESPLKDSLCMAAESLRGGQEAIRRSVWGLRASELEGRTLPQAIAHSLDLLTAGTGIVLDLDLPRQIPGLQLEQEHACLRIAQEAAANVLKHSRATRMGARLSQENGGVILEIRDNGTGFRHDPAGQKTEDGPCGLKDMRERAASLAGHLTLTFPADGGTCVRLSFPLPAALPHAVSSIS
jgi:signal transduction histidine kinase